MSFSPDFLDELRQRLPLSQVVGRKVRLIRKGWEHSGLCPFHNEKTPSFTVNDDKAFYHCFGCGAHGDVIRFVMDSEGLGFRETVERLAREAGLEVPDASPEDKAEASLKSTLYEVLEAAVSWFQSQLGSRAGQAAMDYLKGRGLSAATIAQFRLGLAPDTQSMLKDALIARKFEPALIDEAGLMITPGDGRAPFDRFRHRVMFPITDSRGKVIAFGGRTLGASQAKYLNSPETPLFHKGQLLYNLAGARKAAHASGQVIVVEGYMDVIALAQAGFEHTVAPLGTALTEEQLALLWRLAPEPSLCFDGDAAGMRAAHRAAARALPLLKPGHSLKFVLLPEGEDPDTFIKGQSNNGQSDSRRGAEAFAALLGRALPLADILWHQLTDGMPADTPERRAGLEAKIDATLDVIADAKVRAYYRQDFRDRFAGLLKARRGASRARGGARDQPSHRGRPKSGFARPWRVPSSLLGSEGCTPRLAQTELAQPGKPTSTLREKLLVLIVLNHPELLERHMEQFAGLELATVELDKLRGEIIRIAACDSDLDTGSLRRHLKERGFDDLLARLEHRGALANVWYIWPDAALIDAERGWLHSVAFHQRVLALETEKKAAEKALAENMTEESFERFRALAIQLEAAEGQEASLEGFGLASGREIPA